MAKPISALEFNANGLSVQFTDRSSGIINSWLWDFGDAGTSIAQNPTHVFASAGKYKVSLAVTNSDGTDTSTFDLVVAVTPTLNLTIKEMVQNEMPGGLAFDFLYFQQRVQKWEIFLQPLVTPAIADDDVFDESKWKPLQRVLIAKLVIYDLIQQAVNSSMSSFLSAQNSINQFLSKVTTTTVMVADYTLAFTFANPTTINLIIIDGISYGPSNPLVDAASFLTYLNGLGKGVFQISGGNLVSLGNSHLITTFNYTQGSGTNTAFTQSNARIIPIAQSISSSGGTSGFGKGPLKHIETGPSKVEWYDASAYWTNIMKGFTVGGPQSGGIIGLLISDICLYARRLNIDNLNLCTFKNKNYPLFIVT